MVTVTFDSYSDLKVAESSISYLKAKFMLYMAPQKSN